MPKLIYLVISWLPVLAGIQLVKHRQSKLMLFYVYSVVSGLTETTIIITAGYGIPTITFVNWFLLTEAILITMCYYNWHTTGKVKNLVIALFIIWLGVFLWALFSKNQLLSDQVLPAAEGLMFMIYAISFLIFKLRSEGFINIKDSQVLISAGLLFFFASTIFIYPLAAKLTFVDSWFNRLYRFISNGSNVITYLIYSYAFLRNSQVKKYSY